MLKIINYFLTINNNLNKLLLKFINCNFKKPNNDFFNEL